MSCRLVILLLASVVLAHSQTPARAAKQAPTEPPLPPVVRTAGALMQQGHFGDAVASLTAAIESDPHSPPLVWLLLSRCFEAANQPDNSVQALRAGLAANPSSAELKRNLGEILFRLKADNQEAGTLLAAAVQAMPRDAEARHFYAQWAFLNDKEDACASNERAALALPGLNNVALVQMQTLLGLCEDKLDHPDVAQQAFEKALAANRKLPAFDPASALQFARFLTVSGHTDRSKALVKEILSHAPSFGPAHLEVAKQHESAGEFPQAVEEAQRAVDGEGNDNWTLRSARSVLAKCLYALGRKDEAERQRQLIKEESARPQP